MGRNKRNRSTKPIKNALVDISLLTCGLTEAHVLRDCVHAINREMITVESQFHVFLNGVAAENKEMVDRIIYTVQNPNVRNTNQRLGFPAGANRAIRQGSAPLILFITDDIILHEGALQTLVRRMDNPEIGLCGLKLIFPKGVSDPNRPAGRVQHIGHGIDLHGEVTHPLLGWKSENTKCNVSREVQSVTGGVFMVRRNVFQKAGGFFEGYGLGYFEDVDLCLTIKNMGHKIFVDTEAVADHYTNASMLKANQPIPMDQNKILFRMRNSQRMIHDSWSFW